MDELEESMMELDGKNLPPLIYINTSSCLSTNRVESPVKEHEDSGTSEGAMDHLDQTVVNHNEQFRLASEMRNDQ